MGFWNDGLQGPSRSRSRSRSSSRSRSRSKSPSRSHVSRNQSRTSSSKHYSSRPSFARSASSFFTGISGVGAGTPRGRSYSSRARPRDGFVAKMRKFLRDLYVYMRRHPVKVFFLVIMPLITGGALTKILATFGVRLPRSLEQMASSSAMRNVGQGERYYARGGARDFDTGTSLPAMGGGIGLGDTIQGALGIAKMFM